MSLQSLVPDAVGMGLTTLLSFVLAALTAVVTARLAIRTRFFEEREVPGETWHGRPISQSDRETYDGLNPSGADGLAGLALLQSVGGPLPSAIVARAGALVAAYPVAAAAAFRDRVRRRLGFRPLGTTESEWRYGARHDSEWSRKRTESAA